MVKIPVRRKKSEAGQAILLVIVAMSVFLLGAVGLAIDGSHLYAQRQLAQAAADAGAQAGVLSMFDLTNTTGTHAFTATTGSSFTCATSDAKTPCYFTQTLNGFNQASDTVTVSFPTAATAGVSSVAGSTFEDPVIQVTVKRNVPATLMKFLGWSTIAVQARGTAAIEDVPSAIPIIVTHPTLAGSLSFNGNPKIKILGGPPQSIQINSRDSGAVSTTSCSNATVDLHLAGPNGNGANFGNHAQGGPSSPCFTFIPGVGRYIDPTSVITDPLANVPVPSSAGLPTQPPTGSATPVPFGTKGCPSSGGCPLYLPGLYSSGIEVKDSTKVGVALFAPGMYYISGGGFNMDSNSAAQMATGMPADTNFPEIGTAGMVVFNTGTNKGDIFSFDANAGAASPISLVGAPDSSKWDGILFYEDPTANGGVHLGTGPSPAHTIQGGGTINLTGTIYINTRTGVNSTTYQNLSLQGKAGSATNITGEIIVNTLSMGGNPNIIMTLDSHQLIVRQVALVQ
jgi:Flp pilus assembly protein TadG